MTHRGLRWLALAPVLMACVLTSQAQAAPSFSSSFEPADPQPAWTDTAERTSGVIGPKRPGIPGKPDPAGLRLLLAELGAAPEESVLVGDGETDVRSARNAGLRCLAVTWGFRSRESLEREAPDALADGARIDTPVEGAGLAGRVEVLPDRLLLYTDDGDAAAAAILERGLHPAGVLVRRSTLEDVFLRLTGRTLID